MHEDHQLPASSRSAPGSESWSGCPACSPLLERSSTPQVSSGSAPAAMMTCHRLQALTTSQQRAPGRTASSTAACSCPAESTQVGGDCSDGVTVRGKLWQLEGAHSILPPHMQIMDF